MAPSQILDAARLAGYAGALAWSLLADDEASDASAVEIALGEACKPGIGAARELSR
jgi:hypothetical protein